MRDADALVQRREKVMKANGQHQSAWIPDEDMVAVFPVKRQITREDFNIRQRELSERLLDCFGDHER